MGVSSKAVCLKIGLVLVLIAFTGLACKNTPRNLWKTSGHADSESMAFRDWDNASNPNATVQDRCASCHSTEGFTEYLTTNVRTIANPPLAVDNMGITCDACHSDEAKAAMEAGKVTFTASGQDATGLEGKSATLCGQCHQGRTYEGNVDTSIAKSATPTKPDVISDKITVVNPHYRAAFAAIKASKSQIGYNYDSVLVPHADSTHPGGTDCASCHNQHSTAVDIGRNGKSCQPCHQFTSTSDVEALNAVIPSLEAELLSTIKAYAADDTTTDADGNTKAKACIAYDDATYPYWLKDSDCDGNADDPAATYASFTPRLIKACYNYTVSKKDPGGFAHNGGYIASLLTASTVDLRLYNANLGK